ncbi:hypothetical protein N3K66_005362 [Trichothecium roseum]|uniref:Uncharacterized protein n=1 Tax=Trichothecium roseum TaxID=47278 RepID=A0ACC0UY48_9HYPO|nr:hypothetical protein N3K66_005362 [Trichothecium roseum]
MAIKTVSVLGDYGVGKKTLTGSLIHKCGLQLPRMEELEREGIRDFRSITSFYERKGYDQGFDAPSGPIVIQKTQAPDIVLWVVDASDAAKWLSSAQELSNLLSSGTLRPREKLLILPNKMDLVDWSQHTLKDLLDVFDKVDLNPDQVFVPISGLQGENILSSPNEHPWVTNESVARSVSAARVSTRPLIDHL